MSERRRLSEVSIGDELPGSTRLVTREDVLAYAEASGDGNPLHRDEAVARAAGFPGIIAHGMLSMGHLAGCVAGWAGDAAALERLKVRFRAPVFLGETIVAGGRVRSVDDVSATAVLDVWVRLERDGKLEEPIRRGEAVVRLARDG